MGTQYGFRQSICSSSRHHCRPPINLFCGTSTLMVVRGQFATCVFALHAPVCSSVISSSAPKSVDSGLQVPSAPLVVSATLIGGRGWCQSRPALQSGVGVSVRGAPPPPLDWVSSRGVEALLGAPAATVAAQHGKPGRDIVLTSLSLLAARQAK